MGNLRGYDIIIAGHADFTSRGSLNFLRLLQNVDSWH